MESFFAIWSPFMGCGNTEFRIYMHTNSFIYFYQLFEVCKVVFCSLKHLAVICNDKISQSFANFIFLIKMLTKLQCCKIYIVIGNVLEEEMRYILAKKTKKTGKIWWQRTRWTAELLKKQFFRFFSTKKYEMHIRHPWVQATRQSKDFLNFQILISYWTFKRGIRVFFNKWCSNNFVFKRDLKSFFAYVLRFAIKRI